MQPGQPGGSDWSFENPFEEQEFAFRMKVEGDGYIEEPKFYNQNGMRTAPLSFGCSFGGEEGPEVSVRVITKSEPYPLALQRDI